MKSIWRLLAGLVRALLLAALVLPNLLLYAPSPLNAAGPPALITEKLAAQRAALDGGSAAEMQAIFPEGYVFSYAFYALAWINFALRDPARRNTALAEAKWALGHLDDPAAKAPFPASLPPERGMFYSAWRAHVLAGVALLESGAVGSSTTSASLRRLRREGDAVASSLAAAQTPFLASYIGQAWPCDAVPAIHALATYDRITGEGRYQATIAKWLRDARARLDGAQLLPHRTDPVHGALVEEARGTSQVIMLPLLADIEPALATQHYARFRARFFAPLLGLPAVLEFGDGRNTGDVDSGPLVFGRSFSVTVMSIGVAQVFGDRDWADATAIVGEVVGFRWTSGGRTTYLGGVLPIGEAMGAYAQVARPWWSHPTKIAPFALSPRWRWAVHGLSAALAALLLALMVAGRKKARHVAD